MQFFVTFMNQEKKYGNFLYNLNCIILHGRVDFSFNF